MNRCARSVSANASRRRPGVNVPLAAPNCAVEAASLASCWSVLPEADGNWPAAGCSAADRLSTAGEGFDVVAAGRAAVVLELCVAELPHAAIASAAAAIANRRSTTE